MSSQRGITLIEVVIYLAISAIIFTLLAGLFTVVLRSRESVNTVNEVTYAMDRAFENITREIRQAQSVIGPTIGLAGTELSLAHSDSLLNPTVFTLNAGDNRIYIQQGGGAQLPVTPDSVRITNVRFTNVAYPSTSDAIRIELSAELDSTPLYWEYSYNQKMLTTAVVRTAP